MAARHQRRRRRVYARRRHELRERRQRRWPVDPSGAAIGAAAGAATPGSLVSIADPGPVPSRSTERLSR